MSEALILNPWEILGKDSLEITLFAISPYHLAEEEEEKPITPFKKHRCANACIPVSLYLDLPSVYLCLCIASIVCACTRTRLASSLNGHF